MVEKYPVDGKTAENFEEFVRNGDGQSAMNLVEQVGSCHWPSLRTRANLDAQIWGHGFEVVDAATNTEDNVKISMFKREYNYNDRTKATAVIPIGTSKELPRCKDP